MTSEVITPKLTPKDITIPGFKIYTKPPQFLPETYLLFKDKEKEAKEYLSFLKKIDSKGSSITYNKFSINDQTLATQSESITENIDTNLIHSLKSSYILLLYSFSEAIATTIMREIHLHLNDEFNNNSLPLRKIHNNLMNKIIHHILNEKKCEKNIKEHIQEYIKKPRINSIDKSLFREWLMFYEEKMKEEKSCWFSGNVDHRKIKEIGETYGFYKKEYEAFFRKDQGSTLVKVKNGRNQLAHGKKSFIEYGNDFTTPELEKFYTDVTAYLKTLIRLVNSYLENKSYIS
ncbi:MULTISPECIES: MAE_28990/MAE_18760 family HEPN-like nuclease [Pasteurellaceae]|uniref:MAE_28990/MAE_18760 family HEPN-like nuclease n=1 Tax=Pasteurella atlantica TaxID=2827233 RepID=A0AAW8CLU4_9PAST|nr:MAE_28990/MAE_18760 family HEPN-like nuclease [Pasteurella atlantica]MBR0574184.1 hypothetical protein [Pasteurella atlantica]MDP8039293.1 MAE_28990/MAE_18760 family HEPN-like nuclease [Pasteurella atlantica]MDP8041385.1 MAE_28990/MAE_18760 family HEPN-like nuclease [Pasteurella atlantica]MDP8043521.1 MAE_28990/MAE_18760 family HEPN-like nuclease [Pasteurella atlantica]MDP8045561.1 MAE_28990/MAE_18760 family HEPN-like nuclease [Pasteurella atlantica]